MAMNNGKSVLLLVIAALIIFAGIHWYFRSENFGFDVKIPPKTAPVSSGASASLGENILNHAQNPIQNKVPDTNPINTNPVEGLYKNPFE